MLDSEKKPKREGYEPAGPKYTLAQLQDMESFFFKLSESRTAQTLATLAAVGAILEGIHILWLLFLWVWGRLPR